jgi:hypothetical protein
MAFSLRRKKTVSNEEFWSRLEQELGRPILATALGRYISGRGEPGPLWGLLYFTETTLYFRHFAQTNWFTALTTADDPETEDGGSGRSRNVLVEVSLAHIAAVERPKPAGLLGRLLSGPDTEYRLRSMYSEAEPIVISVENQRHTFIDRLEQAINQTS